jgi:hypothetical protein
MLLWMLTAMVTAASEPAVTQLDHHRVRGTIDVAAPVERVRAVLSDPRNIARIDDDGTTITMRGSDENCQLAHAAVAHPIANIEYLVKVCPVPDGWRSTLVQSDHLEAFESVWKVEAQGTGSQLLYEIRTIPKIPVPQFIVDRQTRASVHALLVKMRSHLDGETPPG